MSIEEKLCDELSFAIHAKYNGIVSKEYIKNAILIHLDKFFKSVARSAVLMESAFTLSSNDEEDEDDSDGSSGEMWKSISQSKFVSCCQVPI